MKILARGLFSNDDAVKAGVAALRYEGYEVLTHIFPDEADYVFFEASRDAPEEHGADFCIYAEFDRVRDIIGPFGGNIDDCGPPPAGHVPFQYEAPAWRGQSAN
jgi:hypothetical protein